MRRLILRSQQSPGDILMLTAAVRDLHAAHPGRFQTDVRTSCPDLWTHNPLIQQLSESDSSVEQVEMHYPLIHESNQRPYHFLHGYPQHLEQTLGVRIPLTKFQGDVHLSEEERAWPPVNGAVHLPERYWILVAGGKYDFTAKWWNPESYQKVVDHFRGRIQFVQCGEAGHWHPPLDGVINVVGQTSTRQFIRLMHHADGVVCPVTFAMHLAAAVPTRKDAPPHRACVVIAGGREPAHWEQYPQHQYLSTNGTLPCCLEGGCWKSRCQPVGDGDAKDRHDLCERPVQVQPDLRIPQCMEMITPADVIRRIELYYEGGAYSTGLLTRPRKAAAKPPTPSREPASILPLVKPRIQIDFPHGLTDVIQLSIVLRHLRHYHPETDVAVAVRDGCRRLLEGQCLAVVPLDQQYRSIPSRVLTWRNDSKRLLHAPSTRAVNSLLDDFQLSPIEDLCRYQVRVPTEASEAARRLVSELVESETSPVILMDLGDRDRLPPLDLEPILQTIRDQGGRVLWLSGPERIPTTGRVAVLDQDDPRWVQSGVSREELLAGLVQSSGLVIATNGAALQLAAALNRPGIALWPGRAPVTEFDLAPSVLHLIPPDGLQHTPESAAAYFRRQYRHRTYENLTASLREAVAEALSPASDIRSEELAAPVESLDCEPKKPKSAPVAPDEPAPTPPATLSCTSVRFTHGLGDCANFARMIPLYTSRGRRISVECTPDKAAVFRAAGADIVPMADHVHGWGYPPWDVHAGHGDDLRGSKCGWNLSEAPLPHIGEKSALWPEYCAARVRAIESVSENDQAFIREWLNGLPRPIVLLHSKGNTNQSIKSLPDPIAAAFYRELLDRFDGTLVLLDWDNRIPRVNHYRVRHLTEMSGGCSTERMIALMDQADLMIGVDSGPLHTAGLTDTPRVGIWMPGHYPARYSLPDHGQLNLVLSGHTYQWNRYRRVPWNIVEQLGTEYDPAWLANQCRRMLEPPKYLDRSQQAADVQLQQWIGTLCRGPQLTSTGAYADRNRSFDRLFREMSRRFERPLIAETGTIRAEEDWGGAGFFTYLAGAYVFRRGGMLQSVDLSAENCRFASTWTAAFGGAVTIHQQDSVAFLRDFSRPLDVLYVDSLDTYEPGHAEHALREVEAALPWLHARSLILFDDSPWSNGAITGKGAMAVPWLQNRGWKVLYGGYQVLMAKEDHS